MQINSYLTLIVYINLFSCGLSYCVEKILSPKSALHATRFSTPLGPTRHSQQLMKQFTDVAKVALPVIASSAMPKSALASLQTGALGSSAYTTLGNLNICRILNGMWQVSGAHGYSPIRSNVVSKMTDYAGTLHICECTLF